MSVTTFKSDALVKLMENWHTKGRIPDGRRLQPKMDVEEYSQQKTTCYRSPPPPGLNRLKDTFSVICICVYIPHFRKTIFIDFIFIELMYHVYVFITHLSSPDIIKSLRGRKRLEQRVV